MFSLQHKPNFDTSTTLNCDLAKSRNLNTMGGAMGGVGRNCIVSGMTMLCLCAF